MSKSSDNYADAKSSYDTAVNNYNNALSTYAGNAGYKNSVTQARESANNLSAQQARGAAAQAQSAARSAGMSKAAAAAMGAQQSANAYTNAYNNNFNTQQNAAYQAGSDYTAGKSNVMSAQQNQQNYGLQADQNKWNRTWGAIGSGINALGSAASLFALSDERLKDVKDVSTSDLMDRMNSIFKKVDEKRHPASGLKIEVTKTVKSGNLPELKSYKNLIWSNKNGK